MNIRIATAAAGLVALGLSATASATPCGTGGIFAEPGKQVLDCQNGGTRNTGNDNAAYLNLHSFFGQSSWVLLDKTDTVEDGQAGLINPSFWTGFNPSPPQGNASGTFSLVSGIWSGYSSLLAVLKAGNTFSAYELLSNVLAYSWQQTGQGLGLSHISLYGVVGTPPPPPPPPADDPPITTDGNPPTRVPVPEPSSWAILAAALAGSLFAQRRRLLPGRSN